MENHQEQRKCMVTWQILKKWGTMQHHATVGEGDSTTQDFSSQSLGEHQYMEKHQGQ